MKLLLESLGLLLEWIVSVLWLPVHLRRFLQAKAIEAEAHARVTAAQEANATASTMGILWSMGTDTRPLARHLADRLHAYYGVQPSTVAPGTVVPLQEKR